MKNILLNNNDTQLKPSIKRLGVFCGVIALGVMGFTACSKNESPSAAHKASSAEPVSSVKAPVVKPAELISVTSEPWGEVDGKAIHLYTLKNQKGMTVTLLNWGAHVQSIVVPDKKGVFEDVTLGYDTFDEYFKDSSYYGPVVGRFGNRVANAAFKVDGEEYQLTVNNNDNQLHGGKKGLHKRVWDAKTIDAGVVMSYLSVDGEEGYPGNLDIKVTFKLNNDNELKLTYEAETDKTTYVNLTLHTYFNLSGDAKRNILDHLLMINADKTTPVDVELIPDGSYADVAGTPFDFRRPTPIGLRVNDENEQLAFGGGYDHNWVLNDWDGSMKPQLTLYEPESGRKMTIITEEPGMQFYSGNFQDGKTMGKNGRAYQYRTGMCLEPQHFPDSPNQPNYPSTKLRPGEKYQTTSIYRFTTE